MWMCATYPTSTRLREAKTQSNYVYIYNTGATGNKIDESRQQWEKTAVCSCNPLSMPAHHWSHTPVALACLRLCAIFNSFCCPAVQVPLYVRRYQCEPDIRAGVGCTILCISATCRLNRRCCWSSTHTHFAMQNGITFAWPWPSHLPWCIYMYTSLHECCH